LRERKRHSKFFRCAINCQLTLIDICGNYLNDNSTLENLRLKHQ
jgi:hypothetical protein